MSRDRIVLIGAWPPPTGGVATHMTQLRAHLETGGRDVVVLGHGTFRESPRVQHLRDVGRNPLPLAVQVRRAAGSRGTIHGHSALTAYPLAAPLRAFLIGRRLARANWIETIHDETLPARYSGFPNDLQRALVRALCQASYLLATSERLRDFLHVIGVSQPPIAVCGPLLPQIDGLAELTPELAEFTSTREPLLVAVGASTPAYDYVTAARAFSSLKRDHPRAGLVLASSTFARDPETIDATWRALAGHESDVRHVEDLPRAQLRTLMAKASVVVRGPARESFGLSRAEAMLAGTPVVGTNTGEVRHVLIYHHGDPESLLDAVRAALLRTPGEAAAAHAFYSTLAEENLQVILGAYAAVTS